MGMEVASDAAGLRRAFVAVKGFAERALGSADVLIEREQIVAIGDAVETLTTEHVTECFGFPVTVRHEDGRWFARATGSWSASAD